LRLECRNCDIAGTTGREAILNRHGGTASLHSRLGHGTSIYLQIPIQPLPT